MITLKSRHADGPIEIHLEGRLTRADYTETLVPALERAVAAGERLRLLVRLGPDFDGFEAGAAWEDLKLGLAHWSGFERIALVTDTPGMVTAARALAVFLPGPVQVFPTAGLDDARRWLTESLGAVHMRPIDKALHVELLGDIDAAAFEAAEGNLDARIREMEPPRLLLDLRRFEGWQGIGALFAHFALVREHAPLFQRVAVLGDAVWQKAAERLMARFLSAETRFFSAGQEAEARGWLAT